MEDRYIINMLAIDLQPTGAAPPLAAPPEAEPARAPAARAPSLGALRRAAERARDRISEAEQLVSNAQARRQLSDAASDVEDILRLLR
jgi:hypothetical protein